MKKNLPFVVVMLTMPVFAAGPLQAAGEGREIVLAELGKKAEYVIVIPPAAGASVKYAAEELCDYVRGMTGAESSAHSGVYVDALEISRADKK